MLLSLAAQWRRARGRYDSCTLGLYRRIWARGSGARALLAYLIFRRDLGRPLAQRHVPLLNRALRQLNGSQRFLALGLLAEAGYSRSGPFADCAESGVEDFIRARQADWRADFANWLQQRSANGICVVGNGSGLLGFGVGGIDSPGVVVRFNRFSERSSLATDVAARVDVWVTSPGFAGDVPAGVQWVVVSGPDMAFRLQDWRRFEVPRRWGARVLTVPLPPWAELVRLLDAPPSAGLLFLAWVRSLLGSWAHVRAIGFGSLSAGGMPRHHAVVGHRPSSRHNWPAERSVLRSWQDQGLSVEACPESSTLPVWLTPSRALFRLPGLTSLLGAQVRHAGVWTRVTHETAVAGVLAWGRKPSAAGAQKFAARLGVPVRCLEDGFLRSVGLGGSDPPLSIVVDDLGIYYDATAPSRLETLVATVLSDEQHARAQALVWRWRAARVSKYNHAREWAPQREAGGFFARFLPKLSRRGMPPDGDLLVGVERYVLVVDQTFGDASIRYGLASPSSFDHMLASALAENPECSVLLKIHPEVAAGSKRGHYNLAALASNQRVRLLGREDHPVSLIEHAEAVYVVTSQVGFEALLWGKRVRTFGMPFYAGWGLTHDDLPPPERRRGLSSGLSAGPDQAPLAVIPLEQLVHAALVAYPRYLDPETGATCDVERLIEWLGLQRRMRERFPSALVAVGFSRWKKPLVRSFFQGSTVRFRSRGTALPAGVTRVVWGRQEPISEQGQQPMVRSDDTGRTIHLEDGFLRSVGLGADHVRPLSWVVDGRGIYYDATQPSDLEELLQTREFDHALLARARVLRERLVASGLTKYNVGQAGWVRPPGTSSPAAAAASDSRPDRCLGAAPGRLSLQAGDGKREGPGRRLILVPGQVESDASLAYGAPGIRRNVELLSAVRAANPGAYVIYKPHPDVVAGLRGPGHGEADAARYCDALLGDVAMGDLLPQVDEVHTLTSLAGFEALLRGKEVVCYGQPFYAGWGLTRDVLPPARRSRKLTIDQLVAGVLIVYPTYVSRTTGRFTTAERALDELLVWRATADAAAAPAWRERCRWALRRVVGIR